MNAATSTKWTPAAGYRLDAKYLRDVPWCYGRRRRVKSVNLMYDFQWKQVRGNRHRRSGLIRFVGPMDFRIADTFTAALARLPAQEQKAVKTSAFDMQLDPAGPGLQFHRIEAAKDPNFWSVRVNRDIRIIVHRTAAACSWLTSITTTRPMPGPSGGGSRRIRAPAPCRSSNRASGSRRRRPPCSGPPPSRSRCRSRCCSRASRPRRCSASACPRTGSRRCAPPPRRASSTSPPTSPPRPPRLCSIMPRRVGSRLRPRLPRPIPSPIRMRGGASAPSRTSRRCRRPWTRPGSAGPSSCIPRRPAWSSATMAGRPASPARPARARAWSRSTAPCASPAPTPRPGCC